MKVRCENCRYFKYVDSNVYGRCQHGAEQITSDGMPRIPWAMVCQSYEGKTELDRARFQELLLSDPKFKLKLKNICRCDEMADDDL